MKSSPLRSGDLELNQDVDRQQKIWTFQRIGWAGMALVIFAALAGLFGSGLFARSVTNDDRQLFSMEYDRFGRYKGELVFRFRLSPEAVAARYVTLWVNRAYWADQAVEHILPEPTGTRIESDGFVYTFEMGTTNTSGVLTFRLRPECIGGAHGHFRMNGQGSARFRQFIFP